LVVKGDIGVVVSPSFELVVISHVDGAAIWRKQKNLA